MNREVSAAPTYHLSKEIAKRTATPPLPQGEGWGEGVSS